MHSQKIASGVATALLGLGLSFNAAAGTCLVAEDPVGDGFQPLLDIVSLSMGAEGDNLVTEIGFAQPLELSVLSTVVVIMDGRRYVRAYLDASTLLVSFEYGSYTNNGDGTVNFSADGDAEGSVSGTVVSIVAPLAGIGLSGTVTVHAESGQIVVTGLDSTDDATYAMGSSCSKAHQGVVQVVESSGVAPFMASFDASLSEGDGIESYLFDFGDGSAPVHSVTPHVSHLYAEPGEYRATVQPLTRDGQKGQSGEVVVSARSAVAQAGSGAASVWFCILLGAGLLRRRLRRV